MTLIFLNEFILSLFMKLLFIPNWNGHLYLQEENDNSVSKVYSKLKSKDSNVDKEIIDIVKNNISETNKVISKRFKELINKNEFILSVTGDHSNSYPLMKEFNEKYGDFNSKIIIFDAHPDVEVSTNSVSHEDYLRNLIENCGVLPQNIYLFGLRTFSRTELEYLFEKCINFFTIVDILKNKSKIIKVMNEIGGDNVYLSLDIDVLDPDYAPGTYYREWCGLNIDELIKFVKIIKNKNNLRAVDICEYYKEKDVDDITLNNVLKLINVFVK